MARMAVFRDQKDCHLRIVRGIMMKLNQASIRLPSHHSLPPPGMCGAGLIWFRGA